MKPQAKNRQNLADVFTVKERPSFTTRADVEPIILKYFEDCDKRDALPSLEGIALSLGFNEVSMLKKFAKNVSFKAVIARALTIVRMGYVETLQKPDIKQTKGLSYLLNNLFLADGFSDKHDLNIKADIKETLIRYPVKVKAGTVMLTSNKKPLTKQQQLNRLSKSGIKKTPDVVVQSKSKNKKKS
jgi:hypothetical protein